MQERYPYLLPLAIVIAGAILAVTIYVVRVGNDPVVAEGDAGLVRPLSTVDHIIGSPEAPVIIVEYSDIDCEYCKNYQATLAELMREYAPSGQVAWVYRHFPLISSHANAATHAEAAECAAELGGPEAFWQAIDRMQQAAPGSAQFSPGDYDTLAPGLGIDPVAFDECIRSGRFTERVTMDFENAIEAGAVGTPHTVVLIEGSEPISIKGALPYQTLKQVIDTALSRVVTTP